MKEHTYTPRVMKRRGERHTSSRRKAASVSPPNRVLCRRDSSMPTKPLEYLPGTWLLSSSHHLQSLSFIFCVLSIGEHQSTVRELIQPRTPQTQKKKASHRSKSPSLGELHNPSTRSPLPHPNHPIQKKHTPSFLNGYKTTGLWSRAGGAEHKKPPPSESPKSDDSTEKVANHRSQSRLHRVEETTVYQKLRYRSSRKKIRGNHRKFSFSLIILMREGRDSTIPENLFFCQQNHFTLLQSII
ncbi:hypothetical protein YC2023_057004 [Brassica napus]